jgi:hypothetical protein
LTLIRLPPISTTWLIALAGTSLPATSSVVATFTRSFPAADKVIP